MKALLLYLLTALLAGCVSDGPVPRGAHVPAGQAIEEVHLFSVPVALNLDQRPGPDGFAVRVYASSHRIAKGLPIQQGRLEVLMFDGVVKNAGRDEALRTWTFPAEALNGYLQKTSIGTGYRIALDWGEARPTQDCITLLVRYYPPQGAPLYSSPSTLVVGVK